MTSKKPDIPPFSSCGSGLPAEASAQAGAPPPEGIPRPGRNRIAARAPVSSIAGVLLCAAAACLAADPPAPPPAGVSNAAAVAASSVEIKADRIDFDRRNGVVTATGGVVAVKGDMTLKADFARFSTATEDVEASGHVVLVRSGSTMTGDRLRYNFRTGSGDWDRLSGGFAPFQVVSEKSEKTANVFALHNASVTTCTNAMGRWHYHVSAKRIEVIPGKSVKARNAVWHFGGLPVMFVPYWNRDLDREWRMRLLAGYNSRMGSFLLSSIIYPVGAIGLGETHLDLRTERGVAVGQEFEWKTKNTRQELLLYYADDMKPTAGDEARDEDAVDRERYRMYFREMIALTKNDYMLLRLDYLSDPYLNEDFFEREYRRSAQPENYLTLAHRAATYTAGVEIRTRLNDFFGSVGRLPEAYVEFLRRPIGGGFYYEGRTAAGFIERDWPDDEATREAYSAFRMDSNNRLLRPVKCFGFLNLVPRAGARGTYYSKTLETDTWTETEQVGVRTNVVVGPGGVTKTWITPVIATNTFSEQKKAGDGTRGSAELGLESSFKAFRTWERHGVTQRHVVEPYANYTFLPEPSIDSEDLYQFDGVDSLSEQHWVDIGVRNKLQEKDGSQARNLVDVDVFARVMLGDETEDKPDAELHMEAEFRPAAWLRLNADSVYNAESSELDRLDLRVLAQRHGPLELWSEYIFRNDDSSLLGAKATWFMNDNWRVKVYGRYEFDDSRMEEEWAYFQRDFDCMSVKGGVGLIPAYTDTDGVRQPDEWRFIVEFWLKAFPEVKLSSGHWD